MKTARPGFFVFELRCPFCWDVLVNDISNGFTFDTLNRISSTIRCFGCGRWLRVPKRVSASTVLRRAKE